MEFAPRKILHGAFASCISVLRSADIYAVDNLVRIAYLQIFGTRSPSSHVCSRQQGRKDGSALEVSRLESSYRAARKLILNTTNHINHAYI